MIETQTARQAPQRLASGKPMWLGLLPIILVVAASLAVFFGHLGDQPLFNPDEGLYAEPAREMLDTGEYITTLLNYSVRFTKPPLVIWLMALGYKAFGVSEFAARLPGALAATLLVVATYCFAARFLTTRVALLAASMLVTAPLYIGLARMAITDMPLALFTAAGLMAFFTAYRTKSNWMTWLGYVFFGLAVMTKGPVGVVLPSLILSIFYIIRGRAVEALRFFNLPLGFLIVSAIALPWFLVEIYLTKGAYFQEFILRENFQRFTSVVDSHKGGWWYHLAVMFAGFFPWSVFLPQAVAFCVARGSKDPANAPIVAEAKQADLRQDVRIFSLCWAIITLVFFSVSVSKLLPYTIPAFPALALLVALEVDDAMAARAKLTRLLLPFAIIASVFAVALFAGGFALERIREAPMGLANIIHSFALTQDAVTLACLAFIVFGKRKEAIQLFTACFLISILYFGQAVLPEIATVFEGDIPNYASLAGRSNKPIIVYDLRKPGVPFYAKRKVLLAADADELGLVLKELNNAYIITRARNIDRLKVAQGYKVVAQDKRFALLEWKSRL